MLLHSILLEKHPPPSGKRGDYWKESSKINTGLACSDGQDNCQINPWEEQKMHYRKESSFFTNLAAPVITVSSPCLLVQYCFAVQSVKWTTWSSDAPQLIPWREEAQEIKEVKFRNFYDINLSYINLTLASFFFFLFFVDVYENLFLFLPFFLRSVLF